MAEVSSLLSVGQSVFDLNSNEGILEVLTALRVSELRNSEKNEIRDLVFLYSNGGKDESVKLALEKKILQSNLKPATPKKTQKEAPKKREHPTIGTIRNIPAFSVPTVDEVVKPETKVEDKPVAETIKTPSTPAPVTSAESVESKEVRPKAESVASEISTAEKPSAPEVKIEVKPQATSPAPVSIDDRQTEYLNRIKTIKSEVNQKVGNPVNIIDIDNTIGREYMSALLDAMKKLNAGVSAVSAMERLEKSYSAVEKLLKDGPETPPTSTSQASSDDKKPQSAESKDVTPPSSLHDVIKKEEPLAKPKPAYTPPPASLDKDERWSQSKESAETTVSDLTSPSTPKVNESTAKSFDSSSLEAALRPEPEDHSPASSFKTKLTSLADLSSMPQKENSVPIRSSLKTPPPKVEDMPASNPLMAKEVDDGLEQLLQEWPIFKKSGLFGTGPSGREHPLFKKIAPLQIPLLLAGRFEGATQEIKQSITDYMNGWRYEQGLIYEQGETFEHYLRRVIRHIIDLQKNKNVQ